MLNKLQIPVTLPISIQKWQQITFVEHLLDAWHCAKWWAKKSLFNFHSSLWGTYISLNPYFKIKETEAYRVKWFAQGHRASKWWDVSQVTPKFALLTTMHFWLPESKSVGEFNLWICISASLPGNSNSHCSMKIATTHQRFSSKSATFKTGRWLVENNNSHIWHLLREELQLINVEGMREIENPHRASTIVIIAASKIQWWMLILVGERLRRHERMGSGIGGAWRGHRWSVMLASPLQHRWDIPLSYLQRIRGKWLTLLESDSPSLGRHIPYFLPLPNSGTIYLDLLY